MIVTCTSHGRTDHDARSLAKHLLKAENTSISVVATKGVVGTSIPELLSDLRRNIALSRRAIIGFLHITISPSVEMTKEQRDQTFLRVLSALGAEAAHPWIAIEHEKPRASGQCNHHWHLVVAHVGGDGRALSTSNNFAKLEAVARTIEYDFGEELVCGRHFKKVFAILEKMNRGDVAEAITRLHSGNRKPLSAISTEGRFMASKTGIRLNIARSAVAIAWKSKSPLEKLKEMGFSVSKGMKDGILVVSTQSGAHVGALHRLVHDDCSAVWMRWKELTNYAQQQELKNGREPTKNKTGIATSTVSSGRDTQRDHRDTNSSGGDTARHANNIGNLEPRRAIPAPRSSFEDRSQNRRVGRGNSSPRSPSRGSRHRRALIEQKIVDNFYKKFSFNDNFSLETKRRIWISIYGTDIPRSTLDELIYFDRYSNFLICKSGWVQDCGNILYCSGSDAESISLMVSVAVAKGWKAVEIWGDDAFLAEARRQLEAMGISVTIRGKPPIQERLSPRSLIDRRKEIETEIATLEDQLNELLKPLVPDTSEIAYRKAILNLQSKRTDNSDAVPERTHEYGLFTRIFRIAAGFKSGVKATDSETNDDLDGQIDFYRRIMSAHRERREIERKKKLTSLRNELLSLRDSLASKDVDLSRDAYDNIECEISRKNAP